MNILSEGGFALSARLLCEGGVFKVEWLTQRALGSCIYVYVKDDCPIYVGHGKTLASRINGERGWLNGNRPKQNPRQQRRWIDRLGTCTQVKVWAKPSFQDFLAREEEEERWIDRLNNPSLLNERRRRKVGPANQAGAVLPAPEATR